MVVTQDTSPVQDGREVAAPVVPDEWRAMELHDDIIQSLYGVTLRLAAISRGDGTDWDKTRTTLRDATLHIQDSIQCLRQLGAYIRDAPARDT